LEKAMRSALHRRGLRFRKHVTGLPGKPDIVFPRAKIVVFIDGDFWHGYAFSSWEGGLTEFWKEKIRRNIQRDRRNFRRLRKGGWRVIRVWQRRMQREQQACVDGVIEQVRRGARSTLVGSAG